jgi:hypothetical protein
VYSTTKKSRIYCDQSPPPNLLRMSRRCSLGRLVSSVLWCSSAFTLIASESRIPDVATILNPHLNDWSADRRPFPAPFAATRAPFIKNFWRDVYSRNPGLSSVWSHLHHDSLSPNNFEAISDYDRIRHSLIARDPDPIKSSSSDCEVHRNLTDGRMNYDAERLSLTSSCRPGYLLFGHKQIECNATTKKWTELFPHCACESLVFDSSAALTPPNIVGEVKGD